MKTIFSIMLIFLFLSCGGGKKTPENVVPDEDSDQDIDIVDDDDEFIDDGDSDPYNQDDGDSDVPQHDEDKAPDPCENNTCSDFPVTSTGVCIPNEDGKGYSCECKENYEWDGKRYCTGKTRTEECTGLPEHGYWVLDKSSITQQWRGSDEGWWPDAVGRYEWDIPYEKSCYFRCKKTYFWNGEDCVNLCNAEPCKDVPHSDGVCSSVGAALYTCGCEEGYYWWGERLGCIARKPALGNVCAGQNECYDDYYEIECPADPDADFFGQEAHYAKLGVCSPLDITLDNSNAEEPLIMNRNTGLMWQKNIEEANFSWEEADSHCEELVYAGYDDWRLPSVHELMSIVVSNKYQYDYNMIFFRFFKDLEPDYNNVDIIFWTSDKAFTINLHENLIRKDMELPGYIHTAICVRGEKLPGPEFEVSEINGDKVVTDLTTGVMWQNSSEGKMRWENALYKCEHLVYAGYSDWRLPLRNELLSLMNYEKSKPATDYPDMEGSSRESIVFSGTNSGFKIHDTVDIFGKESYLACSADFSDGTISPISKTIKQDYIKYYDFPLYCVRSDICPEGKFLHGLECLDDPCGPASCEVENSTGVCVPKTESAYECQCLDGFFWNGSKCVNPCDTDPCSGIANSDKNCTAVNADLYYCGCATGYTWENGKCDNFATNVKNVGSICTGLDKCYSTEEEIPCSGMKSKPFSGQDAFYASMGKCAPHDYSIKTAANQNIIVDNNTKLEWQQTYLQKALPWNEAYAYCDSLEYGGKNDWRLPAPHEMVTIVDEAYDYPMVDQTYFTDIPGVHPGRSFWTDDVKIINFYSDGWIYSYPSKDDIYFVMCVRGKKLPKARLEVSTVGNDKIAKDSSTGLTWTLRDHSADEWEEALSYCMNLTYAGKTGWRLPNKNELVSLVNFGEAAPIEFYGLWTDCWSSTSTTGNAAMVSLNGKLEYVGKTDRGYAVICVGNFD